MGGLFSERAWAVVTAPQSEFIRAFPLRWKVLGGILIAAVLGVLLGLMGVSSRKVPKTLNRIYVKPSQNVRRSSCSCAFSLMPFPSGHKIRGPGRRNHLPGDLPWSLYGGSDPAGIEAVPKGQFEAAAFRG